MSLAIDVNKVTHVLLADGWHEVVWDKVSKTSSFDTDAYEFVQGREGDKESISLFDGGQSKEVISTTGATWHDADSETIIVCPLNAVLALKVAE